MHRKQVPALQDSSQFSNTSFFKPTGFFVAKASFWSNLFVEYFRQNQLFFLHQKPLIQEITKYFQIREVILLPSFSLFSKSYYYNSNIKASIDNNFCSIIRLFMSNVVAFLRHFLTLVMSLCRKANPICDDSPQSPKSFFSLKLSADILSTSTHLTRCFFKR